jgi:hypothetical protein
MSIDMGNFLKKFNMRKIYKIINIALIFTLILGGGIAYSADISCLRVPFVNSERKQKVIKIFGKNIILHKRTAAIFSKNEQDLLKEFDVIIANLIEFYKANASYTALNYTCSASVVLEIIYGHINEKGLISARIYSNSSLLDIKHNRLTLKNAIINCSKTIEAIGESELILQAFSDEQTMLYYADLLVNQDKRREIFAIELKTNSEFRNKLISTAGIYLKEMQRQINRLNEIMSYFENKINQSLRIQLTSIVPLTSL